MDHPGRPGLIVRFLVEVLHQFLFLQANLLPDSVAPRQLQTVKRQKGESSVRLRLVPRNLLAFELGRRNHRAANCFGPKYESALHVDLALDRGDQSGLAHCVAACNRQQAGFGYPGRIETKASLV